MKTYVKKIFTALLCYDTVDLNCMDKLYGIKTLNFYSKLKKVEMKF